MVGGSLPQPHPSPIDPAAASAAWTERGAGSRNVVLLLEDNETIANLLVTVMQQRLSLKVVWAASAAGGLQEFERHSEQIAIVVADCRLPDGDGRVVCHQIRALQPGLPVLLTSGRFAFDNFAPLEAGPGVDFLPKPYAPAEMVGRVREILTAHQDRLASVVAGFV